MLTRKLRRLVPRAAHCVAAAALALAGLAAAGGAQQVSTGQQVPASPLDIVFRNATVMTASHGTIEHGAVWVHAGKIAGVGATVDAPASATVVDATGEWLTPGIIDPHSHSALDSDVNEATSPVTPAMHMIDAFDNRDKALYQALAGGVTTELLLHGSANMIGGQLIRFRLLLQLRAVQRSPAGNGLRPPASPPRANAAIQQPQQLRPALLFAALFRSPRLHTQPQLRPGPIRPFQRLPFLWQPRRRKLPRVLPRPQRTKVQGPQASKRARQPQRRQPPQ